jgi:kynurenine formamidase
MFKMLSYPIRENDAVWPDNFTVALKSFNSMDKGDPCNTFIFEMNNHFGTHIDAPRHFIADGVQVAELPLERFIFECPLLLDIPKSSFEKIQKEDLIPFAEIIAGCDLLMIRTGFSKYRDSNRESYTRQNPSMSSGGAKYLMDNFPNIKALALDTLSLASFSDPQDGDLAHQYILGKYHDRFVCIIEDVDLSGLVSNNIVRVFAVPLFIKGLDSSPVTMFAEIK